MGYKEMIIEKELHYTTKHNFTDLKKALDGDDMDKVIQMFKQRVKELYLDPAKYLIEGAKKDKNIGFVFSAGLICVSAIDFLGRFYAGCPKNDVKNRFVCWILTYMRPPFDGNLATKFYDDFRNGLVHECRIKNGGEFTLEIKEVVELNGKYLRVNPKNLRDLISKGFEKYVEDIKRNEVLYVELRNCLNKDFEEDFKKEGDE